MKNVISNGLLGIVIYFVVGLFFWGNHYFMLPLFLILIAGISFFLNRKKDLVQVKQNLFWMGAPIIALLLITSFGHWVALKITITYTLLTFLALAGVYMVLNSTDTSKKFALGIAILLLPVITLTLCGYLSENKDIVLAIQSSRTYLMAIGNKFF